MVWGLYVAGVCLCGSQLGVLWVVVREREARMRQSEADVKMWQAQMTINALFCQECDEQTKLNERIPSEQIGDE